MTKKARNIKSDIIKNAIKSIDPHIANRVDNRMYVSARIKELMDQRGLLNNDLAELLKKQPSMITRWLSGTHNFTLDTVSDIETILGERIIQKIEEPSDTVYHFVISEEVAKVNELMWWPASVEVNFRRAQA
ncbi:MAG: helix-turn-helix transcriptional regulator [Saprospiraceae bacterium]|nr:helix-turn-helix transcriptional regulator [Saprospiraceae bacterium]